MCLRTSKASSPKKAADTIVMDVHGVGFLLNVSGATLAAAPAVGERMRLYCTLSVREDALELFGFYSREEKRMYERLRGVSGVGPRMAMQLLSAMSVRDLSVALASGDAHALTRVPGIGKKTAQRLVLELRDKIDETALTGTAVAPAAAASGAAGGGGCRAGRAGLYLGGSRPRGRAGCGTDRRRQPADLPRAQGKRFRRGRAVSRSAQGGTAMEIEIYQLIEGARRARGLAVIIDVFRAFTVECHAFARGARTILPVAGIDEAFALKRAHPGALLVGERGGPALRGIRLRQFAVAARGVRRARSRGRAHHQRWIAGRCQRNRRRGDRRRVAGQRGGDGVIHPLARAEGGLAGLHGTRRRARDRRGHALRRVHRCAAARRVAQTSPPRSRACARRPAGSSSIPPCRMSFPGGTLNCARMLNRFPYALLVRRGEPLRVEKVEVSP